MHFIAKIVPLLAALSVGVVAKPIDGPITSAVSANTPSPTSPAIETITVAIPAGASAIPPGAGPKPNNGTNSPDGWYWPTYCSGRDMPNDEFESINAAKDLMDRTCGAGIKVPARTGYIYRSKNAQVYFCNYANEWIHYESNCSLKDYNGVESLMDIACGAGGGGWHLYDALSLTEHSVGRDPRYTGDGTEINECGF